MNDFEDKDKGLQDEEDLFHLPDDFCLVDFVTKERVQDLYDKVDNVEYPETGAALLMWQTEEEQGKAESPMKLAGRLFCADQTLPMQRDTADFLKQLYEDQIKAENVEAITSLGRLYYSKRSSLHDYSEAKKYFEMAYEKGNLLSSQYLGIIWYYGFTGNVDYEKAFRYFVKAALAGLGRSIYMLGDCYRYGHYVEKDEKEAFSLYKQILNSLDEDDSPSIRGETYMRMGDCLLDGIGTDKDLINAQLCLSRAELLFYECLKYGDFEQRNNLDHVMEQENKIRKLLMEEMPDFSWAENSSPEMEN